VSRSEAVLFYDARCPGCRAFTHLILWADTDHGLRSSPLDSPEADRALGHLSREARYGSFHLLEGDRLWSGGDAVGPTLERLRPVRGVGRLIRRSPAAGRATAALYDLASRHRGRVAPLFRRIGRPPR
jgi:predicted DCC family thiol-disulfide oxidoreductase YuxK